MMQLLGQANAMRILVADDDELLRENIQLALSARGHSVTASEGFAARSLLANERWDALLVDILMPDVDGLEMIQVARGGESPPFVVAISGGGKISAEQCLSLASDFGAEATFCKPLDLDAVVESLEQGAAPAPLRS